MLTVTVCLLASGNSSTRRPLASRYSVMPSTEVTRSGGAGATGGGSRLILRASAGGSSATHRTAAARIGRALNGIPCSLGYARIVDADICHFPGNADAG